MMWEEIENQLTPDFIDGVYSEVKKKKQTGDEIKGTCPFHEDNNPSFTFNPSKNGVYKCHSGKCGASGNLVTYLKEVKKIAEPVEWLKENLRVSTPYNVSNVKKEKKNKEVKTISSSIISEAKTNLLNSKQRLEFLYDLGISKEVIRKLNIGYKEGRYWLPIKDERGRFVNVRKYDPENTTAKYISFGAGYGSDRLYPIESLESDEIYVFEGEKDTLLALSLGLNAITNTCGCESFKQEWGKLFSGKTVYICMDIDDAGQKGANKRESVIKKYAESVTNIVLDLDKTKHPKGDFFDYIKFQKKTLNDFLELCDPTKQDKLDEYGIALRLLKDKDLVFIEDQRIYEYCDKNFWSPISDTRIEKYIQDILLKNKIRPKQSKVQPVVKTLKPIILKQQDEFEMRRNCINFKNGILNLDTFQIEPHDKQFFITQRLENEFYPHILNDYQDKLANWMRFLNDIFDEDQERIRLLQEVFGYCLTTDTKLEKAFILKGSGRNGKTTVIRTLENIIGHQNVANVSFSNLIKDFSRASLYNKLLNTSGEMDFNNATSTEFFKAIVSGDTISAEEKHKPPFSFRPFCKLLYSTNDLPKIKDRTFGYFRKIIIIPFNKKIPENKIDVDLSDKLKAEYPQIIAWALHGLDRLRQNRRFSNPTACDVEMNQYQHDSNSIMQFIEECCELDSYSKANKKYFVKAYQKFCIENQMRAFGTTTITKELFNQYGIEQKKSNADRFYAGVKLIEEPAPVVSGGFGSFID
jgi:putative DNA primase/helicase